MIFGTTFKEREAKKQQRLEAAYGIPVKKFAWHPLLMKDGKYAWLEDVFYVPKITKFTMICGPNWFCPIDRNNDYFQTADEALAHAVKNKTAPIGSAFKS